MLIKKILNILSLMFLVIGRIKDSCYIKILYEVVKI